MSKKHYFQKRPKTNFIPISASANEGSIQKAQSSIFLPKKLKVIIDSIPENNKSIIASKLLCFQLYLLIEKNCQVKTHLKNLCLTDLKYSESQFQRIFFPKRYSQISMSRLNILMYQTILPR